MSEPKLDSSPLDTGQNSHPVPFSVSQQIQFILKELRETLRDRRTIVTLMAMPLILYPLLGIGFRFLALQQTPNSKLEYRLALATEEQANWLSTVLKSAEQLVEKPQAELIRPEVQLLVPNDESNFDLESMVVNSAADLGIKIEFGEWSGTNSQSLSSAKITLLQNQSSTLSRDVADYVSTRLSAANIEIIKGWAKQNNRPFTVPIAQTLVSLKPPETGSAVLGLLPLILLLMTVTGGVYPAIDLTAGERERNTLETLMALPVPRFRLLLAKYVAVVAVTMLTGLVNLIAMSVTLYSLQLDKSLLGGSGFTFGLGIKLFLVLTAFALFYAAVLLLLTSSAKSFKEAQAYLIPLLLLSIAPGLVILMPGWSLERVTAAIPLVNMLLLSKELLEGTVQFLPATVAVISTVLYGIAALAIAAQVFGNDAVAIGSRGSWKEFLHRPSAPATQPSIASAFISLAVLFPAYFIASGMLSRGEDVSPSDRLAMSAAMTVFLFVGLPWLFLRYQRIGLRDGLRLVSPRWNYIVAAALLGVATWPWVFELIVLMQSWGIRGIDLSRIEDVDKLLAGWKSVPLWATLLALGVVPGICEECFFRGYLFNGLRQHFNAAGTIATSAVAFGLFHVVLAGGAAPERLLPSTLMGVILGCLAWRSGSVLPSILLHIVHNCTLLVVVQSRDRLAEWNFGQMEQTHLPWTWLLVASVACIIGIVLLFFAKSTSTHVPRRGITTLESAE